MTGISVAHPPAIRIIPPGQARKMKDSRIRKSLLRLSLMVLLLLPGATGPWLLSCSGNLTDPGSSGIPEPEGTLIYRVPTASGTAYCTISAGGGGVDTLYESTDILQAARWSPDGGKIAFGVIADSTAVIWTMRSDGSAVTRISPDTLRAESPAWFPDGSGIVFSGFNENLGSSTIMSMTPGGAGIEHLLTTRYFDTAPDWDPDRDFLLFERLDPQDGNTDIFKLVESPSETIALTSLPEADRTPKCSPLGKTIIFCSYRDNLGPGEVYRMNPDGSNQRSLTGGLGGQDPCWSPDGEWIAFTRISDDTSRICITRSDGTLPRELTTGDLPDWKY